LEHPAGFPAALGGTWRLVFSAPSPIKAWQYIPVLEDAVIDVERGEHLTPPPHLSNACKVMHGLNGTDVGAVPGGANTWRCEGSCV
jgi:hypothetical protein